MSRVSRGRLAGGLRLALSCAARGEGPGPAEPGATTAAPDSSRGSQRRGLGLQVRLSGDTSLPRRVEDRDDGARLSVWSLQAGVELSASPLPALRLNANLGAERALYEWSDPRGLGSPELSAGGDPWSEVQVLSAGGGLQAFLGRSWSLALRGSLELGVEPGAELEDALSGGGGVTVGYGVSQGLSLGLGVFATSRLEDSPLVIPSLFVRWQLHERVLLETFGPGLRLSWRASEPLTLSTRVGFAFRQWRLEERRAFVPGGIVNDARGEVALGLAWQVGPLSLTGEVGLVAWQELTVRDARGELVRRLRSDPTAVFGLRLELRW